MEVPGAGSTAEVLAIAQACQVELAVGREEEPDRARHERWHRP